MTNLSKQIFECCGIEPKKQWIKCHICGCLGYKVKFKGVEICCQCHTEIKYEEIHPDLETNANNFVRLLEIKPGHHYLTFWQFVNYLKETSPTYGTRKEFLEDVVKAFSKNKITEVYKQAIANEQWEW